MVFDRRFFRFGSGWGKNEQVELWVLDGGLMVAYIARGSTMVDTLPLCRKWSLSVVNPGVGLNIRTNIFLRHAVK